jgi:hypothetical protein
MKQFNVFKSVGLVAGALLLSCAAHAQIGVNTSTPQNAFHINGALQVDSAIALGGGANTAGSVGTNGQVLTSGGSGQAAKWTAVPGTVRGIYTQIGTTQTDVTVNTEAVVPGTLITHTVPAGETHNILITCSGSAVRVGNQAADAIAQGAFKLYQGSTVISSSIVNIVDAGPNDATTMSIPATFQKMVTLTAGTYTFRMGYFASLGNSRVNSDDPGAAFPDLFKSRISVVAYLQ